MSEEGTLRLDVWLWRARFFKTRALSTAHVKGHGVRLSHMGQTRKTDKPGTSVNIGDVVTFGKAGRIYSVQVLDLGDRRGPAEEARALYRPLETDP
ncbi:RNA-binding S4 domain-containing protein [Hyphomonas sp. WL0036]|uniref:RNA-binding S4 domain-containing protein n=1 Tax=Hyphomonas sediminis TaxID=2866160 RepID=UPI001C81B1B3|nr:RNA-binding S4 domain-containing protein [Hyphomonas sediminis]MBY9066068.1 RNA-binding S4 domain-containing protein [Hyphomonas sediminis]